MPECILCNSQSFDLMNGMYFCSQCGTHSQDVQEEVNEAEFEDLNATLKVKKCKIQERKVYDCGKPWFTMEGFQVLIKAQIEFLINTGIDPAIKDVIGQMWFCFVELSSNAFGTRQHQNFAKTTRVRDAIKDFTPVDSIHRRSPKKYDRKHRTVVDDALELSSEIAREEFYEDDDPTRRLFEDDAEDADSDSHVGSVDGKTRVKRVYCTQFMTLQHTLAFCFLGLMWLQEPVCLSDLIRWALEGQLPYFNATKFFASHMKLSQADIGTFTRPGVPVKHSVKNLAASLRKYIRLPDIPRHPINIYIARYAVDLQLSASIHRYVSSVVELVDLDLQSFQGGVLNYDDLAMAYIIISLKLIYGLDDVTENELSKLAIDIGEDEKLYFPLWSELVGTIQTSYRVRLENGVPWDEEDLVMVKDYRNYAKFCQQKIFGSWKPECTVHRERKRHFKGNKGLNPDKQKEYAKLFESLLESSQDNANLPENVTSFPFLSARSEASTEAESHDTISGLEYKKNAKGLPLKVISRYYEKKIKATDDDGSPCQANRNRYICYNVTTGRTRDLLAPNWWKDLALPKSLRQVVELCAKLIYSEPAILYSVVNKLEKNMFKNSGSFTLETINKTE